MSGVRLPLIGDRARPAMPSGARSVAERALPTRSFVSVAGADTDTSPTPALLRTAQDLLRALAAEGRPALALAVADETRADQLAALRAAGAADVIALEGAQEELARRALAAFEVMPRDALVVGIGSALARTLQPLLALRVAPPHTFDGRADIELPRESAAVCAAIAARLARHAAAG